MANIKSTIKRARQNTKRNSLKGSQRSLTRTAVKVVDSAIASGDKQAAKDAFKKAEKVLDPQYNPTEYGSGENAVALKDKWLHDNMNEVEESEWRQKYMSDVHDFSEVDDYTNEPMVVKLTKKILKES